MHLHIIWGMSKKIIFYKNYNAIFLLMKVDIYHFGNYKLDICNLDVDWWTLHLIIPFHIEDHYVFQVTNIFTAIRYFERRTHIL